MLVFVESPGTEVIQSISTLHSVGFNQLVCAKEFPRILKFDDSLRILQPVFQ